MKTRAGPKSGGRARGGARVLVGWGEARKFCPSQGRCQSVDGEAVWRARTVAEVGDAGPGRPDIDATGLGA